MIKSAILAAAVSLLTGGSAELPSRVLWQGPALAGSTVVWEEASGTGSIHQWTAAHGDRVIYTSDSLALGGPLAASPTLLAFERGYPGCTPQPGVACPQVEDALVGPLQGPFRTLVPPRKCTMPTLGNTIGLDNGVAAYVQLDCAQQRLRVLVRDVARHGSSTVLHNADVSSGCCRDVAVAGRYVAWSERGDVVVYDRLARRVAYRARVAPVGIDFELGFDLQRDGKLAVAYRLIEVARGGPVTVGWLSPSAPRVHVLPARASTPEVRIAGDRIAFARFVTPTSSTLVLADLAGHTQTIAELTPPVRLRSFDFDGRRLAWASDRVTDSRIDCPPPGQGRPCVKRESGVTSIWLRAPASSSPRLLARLPFFDAMARS